MDLLPVSVGLGLAVSLMFSELFGLAAGGMVVPGYIALHLSRPLDVLATVLAGIATYGVVHMLSLTTIIYGKRRTVVMILTGYLIGMGISRLPLDFSTHAGGEVAVIGFIIPGLIGIWIDRQGLIETLSTLLTASIVVRLVLILTFGRELPA